MEKFQDVDTYIESFDEPLAGRLSSLRQLIKQLAPEAVESISYGMPAYTIYQRPLVYFAGYPKHIGLYATPSAQVIFEERLRNYKTGKGSIQFPNEQEIPVALISDILRFRIEENKQKTALKKKS